MLELEPGVPDGVIRWACENAHGCFLDRMHEFDASCVKMDGRIVIGSSCAVFDVTFDGCSQAAERCAYLMMTACFGSDFNEMVLIRTAFRFIGQLRLFSVFARRIERKTLVELLILLKVIHHMSSGRIGLWFYYGPIGFLHFAKAKHIREPR